MVSDFKTDIFFKTIYFYKILKIFSKPLVKNKMKNKTYNQFPFRTLLNHHNNTPQLKTNNGKLFFKAKKLKKKNTTTTAATTLGYKI